MVYSEGKIVKFGDLQRVDRDFSASIGKLHK